MAPLSVQSTGGGTKTGSGERSTQRLAQRAVGGDAAATAARCARLRAARRCTVFFVSTSTTDDWNADAISGMGGGVARLAADDVQHGAS